MKPLLTIEMPLVYVLANMECWGICIDTGLHKRLEDDLLGRQGEVGLLFRFHRFQIPLLGGRELSWFE